MKRRHFMSGLAAAPLAAGAGLAQACDGSGLVADAHPERQLQAIDHRTIAWAGGQQLAFHTVRRLDVAADCSGMPVATLENHGGGNRFAWHAAKAIAGASADEFDITMDALGGPRASGTQVVGGVRYPGDFFIASVAGEKDVLSGATDGLRLGTGSVVDADGYPVALDSGRVLRKQ